MKTRLDKKDEQIKNSGVSGNVSVSEDVEQLKSLLREKNTEFENYKVKIMQSFKEKIAERDKQYQAVIDKQKTVIEQLKKHITDKQ